MKVINEVSQNIICFNASIVDTFFSRFKGLMFKKSFGEGQGLIIKPCNSIHMFFMRFNLDIVFVDKDNRVVYLIEDIKPWRISKVVFKSSYVIELPPNTIKKSKIKIGDKIRIEK